MYRLVVRWVVRLAGWVERSATHQCLSDLTALIVLVFGLMFHVWLMGYASLHPSCDVLVKMAVLIPGPI
ncbi:hypothetical protein [Nitrosospira briensis]|uniref:hypothetical protein n=1 Tax=Nitrosospira briensis TaxID=35799 RepID=UPI001160A0D0|nr:hypothetical protein [Nitrosospira briensis]